MELTQLDYFLSVARLQHMTKASELHSISQPALSHAIAKLEQELGVPLFDRRGRNMQVSRYGRMFAARVERALRELEYGKQEIEEWVNSDSGVISLSYLNILGVELIPSLIRDYQAEYPKVRFDLNQGDYEDIGMLLDHGVSDVMITSKETATASDHLYEWLTFRTMPLYIVVPAGHRFAKASSLSLAELAGEPFVGMLKNCGLQKSLETRLQHTGLKISPAYEVEDLISVAGFIAAGLGMSVLPKTFGLTLEGLVWLPIQEEGWQWEIGLKWKKGHYLSPATKKFVDYIGQLTAASS